VHPGHRLLHVILLDSVLLVDAGVDLSEYELQHLLADGLRIQDIGDFSEEQDFDEAAAGEFGGAALEQFVFDFFYGAVAFEVVGGVGEAIVHFGNHFFVMS
jgi:hypothetical protein